jgi:SAM-dependent methyltransferase
MDYSFPHYLLSKQSVDDRALNRTVIDSLRAALTEILPSQDTFRIIEVGAGIGTMLARLLRWGLLPFPMVEYILVDEMPENIVYARQWLSQWAKENGYAIRTSGDIISLSAHQCVIEVHLVCSDIFAYIASSPTPSQLLVAHAFLDLLPMPESLTRLFSLLKPDGLAWLTVNFDGVTSFEPVVDQELDVQIERLYHRSMDERPTGGDSQSGRHLFGHLEQAGARILSAGASDWVVYPVDGQYPADEAYFLNFILYFFELSLGSHPELDASAFQDWLERRRAQIERGELVYIAHQMDFLVRI